MLLPSQHNKTPLKYSVAYSSIEEVSHNCKRKITLARGLFWTYLLVPGLVLYYLLAHIAIASCARLRTFVRIVYKSLLFVLWIALAFTFGGTAGMLHALLWAPYPHWGVVGWFTTLPLLGIAVLPPYNRRVRRLILRIIRLLTWESGRMLL